MDNHGIEIEMHPIVPKKVVPVIEAIRDAGGRPFVVGGAVRDMLLGIDVTTKDLDFEVYHLTLDTLTSLLSKFGRTDVVGRSFGVIKLWLKGAGEIDFSLPRRESKSGNGHRGFIVSPDPAMSPKEACARRDFTLNAILLDPFDSTLLDFFDGQTHLKNGILRHTSDHFDEDPLRPLRAMQLAARFGFFIDPQTALLSASMASEADFLAKERIFGEWQKWAVHGAEPSRGLRVLAQTKWLAVFPELAAVYASEASAATLDARVDRARHIADREGMDPNDTLVLLLSAVCRDMADPTLSADTFLVRLGIPNRLQKRISLLCKEAAQLHLVDVLTDESVLRCAVRLEVESIAMLSHLLACDNAFEKVAQSLFLKAKALGVLQAPPSPLVLGRDLATLGISPGPGMGQLVKAAFEAQLSGAFKNKEEALRWISASEGETVTK